MTAVPAFPPLPQLLAVDKQHGGAAIQTLLTEHSHLVSLSPRRVPQAAVVRLFLKPMSCSWKPKQIRIKPSTTDSHHARF